MKLKMMGKNKKGSKEKNKKQKGQHLPRDAIGDVQHVLQLENQRRNLGGLVARRGGRRRVAVHREALLSGTTVKGVNKGLDIKTFRKTSLLRLLMLNQRENGVPVLADHYLVEEEVVGGRLHHDLRRIGLPNGRRIVAVLRHRFGRPLVLDDAHHRTTVPEGERVGGEEEEDGLVAIGHYLVDVLLRAGGQRLRPPDDEVHRSVVGDVKDGRKGLGAYKRMRARLERERGCSCNI